MTSSSVLCISDLLGRLPLAADRGYYGPFLSQELCRRHSRDFLEQTAEVVRVLEAQQIGHFAYAETFHQEGFCLVNDKCMDVADGCATGGFMDHIAEIAC